MIDNISRLSLKHTKKTEERIHIYQPLRSDKIIHKVNF